jgi:hypothetical protein
MSKVWPFYELKPPRAGDPYWGEYPASERDYWVEIKRIAEGLPDEYARRDLGISKGEFVDFEVDYILNHHPWIRTDAGQGTIYEYTANPGAFEEDYPDETPTDLLLAHFGMREDIYAHIDYDAFDEEG